MYHQLSLYKLFTLTSLFIFIFSLLLWSQAPKQSVMDINNITMWVRNDGYHPPAYKKKEFKYGSWEGSFPKGTAGVIYSDGLLWGGLVQDRSKPVVRVGGCTYGSGNKAITRIFRVRPDYKDASLLDDASNYFMIDSLQVTDSMITQLRSQYEKDWDEWPADKGAPYYDTNKDGKYEPDIDIPGVPGASQTIWFAYNDDNSYFLYYSPPIGIEVQETDWAYSNDSQSANVIYKRAKIIYKGTSASSADDHIDSMYIAEFADMDIGIPFDGFAGCDTSINLGYAYNMNDSDLIYNKFGLIPPAAGFAFLQTPAYKTGNHNDSAIVDFKWRIGSKYFNSKFLTSFTYFGAGGSWIDPEFSYNGTLQWYNIMRGYLPNPPYPYSVSFCPKWYPIFKDRNCSDKTMLDGDPVTGTGWIDGIVDGPASRRIAMSTGPFNLKLNDTAEVVIALAAGIGTNYLNSIMVLRNIVKNAKSKYDSFVRKITSDSLELKRPKSLINNFIVYQNYPNPFNSSTTIQYFLPERSYVKLEVYNLLGEKIKTLVNGEQIANSYKLKFNAAGLSSGIYFYRITINDMIRTKKLILLK